MSVRISSGLMSIWMESSISGETKTEANEVWRRLAWSKGEMRHAHGGVGGVDVLSALAAGAVGVDAQVFLLDVDLDGLIDFRGHVDGCERSVTSLGGVER